LKVPCRDQKKRRPRETVREEHHHYLSEWKTPRHTSPSRPQELLKFFGGELIRLLAVSHLRDPNPHPPPNLHDALGRLFGNSPSHQVRMRGVYTLELESQRLVNHGLPLSPFQAASFSAWLAATTGARKGELLPRKWSEVQLDGNSSHIYVPKSKNGRPKRLSLAEEAITALRALPSFEEEEYVFPADRGNVRFTGKQMHLWDMRKPFQAACTRAGIEGLRIHDLRHMATTILFLSGIPEGIIRKLTGHRSRELERYEHLSPGLKRQTVDLIALALSEKSTASDTPTSEEKMKPVEVVERIGGDDGVRTRDLRRDRPAF
jgi:integrase